MYLGIHVAECTEEGMIRLADGPDVNEGRLEVCLHGVWGTVTDTFFDSFTARTICNILGYAAGGLRHTILD